MNNITEFNFNNMNVRVIDKDNNPWFVLNDVCQVLDIKNSRDASSSLDDDEKDDVGITDTIGRSQETTIINKSGLYSLILRSRKPKAKRFKKWVTSEVLPAIRKTGSYQSVDLNDPVFLRSTLLTYADKCLALEKENQVMKPKNTKEVVRVKHIYINKLPPKNTKKLVTPEQGSFDLTINCQKEIQGVGMGV